MSLDISTRDDLMDAYFDCVDTEEYGRFEAVFAEDATYAHPSDVIEGRDEIRRLYADRRGTRNTDHDITRRIHDSDASACEGTVTGEFIEGGTFDGEFMDAFEFDAESERISHISVFTRNVY